MHINAPSHAGHTDQVSDPKHFSDHQRSWAIQARSAAVTPENPGCVAQGIPEECIRLFLPQHIDPTDRKWGKGERSARVFYVAHLITTRRFDDWRDCVAIHSPTIKDIISCNAWGAARQMLGPLVEIDDRYEVGRHSKGYRWKDNVVVEGFAPLIIRCPWLKRRIADHWKRLHASLAPVERGVLQDLQALTCLIQDPDEFVSELPPKDGVKSEAQRRAYYTQSIQQLRERSFTVSLRSKNGRSHHTLTNTPRLVRDHVLLDGEATVELDLANSQPYFLASLFPDVPGLVAAVSEGRFYDAINMHLESPSEIANPNIRDKLKKACLMCLYGEPKDREIWARDPNSRHAKFEQAFNAAFRGITDRINGFAKGRGKAYLANEMQRKESQVFIDTVLPILQGMGIRAIPIHDSILCRKCDSEVVENILRQELLKASGINPKLSRKEST